MIPRTCSLVDLNKALAEARHYLHLDAPIVVILHHFDFSESREAEANVTLTDLKSLLVWLKSQFDVSVTTLAPIAGETRSGLAWASLYHRLKKELPKCAGDRISRYRLLANPVWNFAQKYL